MLLATGRRGVKLFEARRPATLEDVSWLRKALGRQLGELRLPGDVAGEIVLAVAELAANLVTHADPAPKELAVEAGAGRHPPHRDP